MPVSFATCEPQPPARAILEKALAATGKHGIDFEAQFVEQAGMQQRFDQPGAAMDADVATRLLLQGLDRIDEIAVEQRDIPAVSPLHVPQRFRRHVFRDAVDMVGKRLVGRRRPEARPLLVTRPSTLASSCASRAWKSASTSLPRRRQTVSSRASLNLTTPSSVDQQVRNDLSHGKSSQVKMNVPPGRGPGPRPHPYSGRTNTCAIDIKIPPDSQGSRYQPRPAAGSPSLPAAAPSRTASGRTSASRLTSILPGSSHGIMWADCSNQTPRL